ncbi:MAG: FGGY-family carbohydrate kinase [Lachnospirales bacterium]
MIKYVISIDQSTQGTKALLFDNSGNLLDRKDLLHQQIVDKNGWVSHDPMEIYNNTKSIIKDIVEKNNINNEDIAGIAISNQRETTAMWYRKTGEPLNNAIVWQCSRALKIGEREYVKKHSEEIREKTGMVLSPYFPALKIVWLLENTDALKELGTENICYGTMDTWLVFKLTEGRSYKTDFSNASRTQLFNICDLKWDEDICNWLGINIKNLPEVVDSNALYGYTTLDGYFSKAIPVHCVMGDSHAALFGQGCHKKGMAKSTYGTGSSVMMNVGEKPFISNTGVVTSLAWSRNGRVNYVLEGNINYTGAVISWLKNDMGMIDSPQEAEELARASKKTDDLFLVPAFSGLGAPHWDSNAKASVVGMDRTTGKAEFVRAGLESIAYQINDVVKAMEKDSNIVVEELRVDGGPTRNNYLMEFQSDLINAVVKVPKAEELSAIGVAYMALITLGIAKEDIFENIVYKNYNPKMDVDIRKNKLNGWNNAVKSVLQ